MFNHINSFIVSDLWRCIGGYSTKLLVLCFLRDPGFRFMVLHRLLTKTKKKYFINRIILRFLFRKYSFKYSLQIPLEVNIGMGFRILHFGGIVINNNVVIGDNCTILQGVTIGNTKRGKKAGAPMIGNKVYLGPGSVVVGGISIGNNVLIAPNAFVNFDVPENSIVIGNPGKIIQSEEATSEYINNPFKI